MRDSNTGRANFAGWQRVIRKEESGQQPLGLGEILFRINVEEGIERIDWPVDGHVADDPSEAPQRSTSRCKIFGEGVERFGPP